MKRILRTSVAFAILMVCHVASVSAQIRGNNIVVSIAPDHSDWNYKVGETASENPALQHSDRECGGGI